MALSRRDCRLRILLSKAGMTQAELSRKTGYSPQQISNWVNDREKMSFEAAATVAYVLECHMEELYELVWT
ncbi:helix-turn-helix domain-containing protein [Bacillus sp. FSL K6-6540]|uniref:helix-turn-helix domain-containing protein n=1 Tax=Bacillus sp. FSL K6-6540 TaxID=2921512 RepID=UPI0030F4DDBA